MKSKKMKLIKIHLINMENDKIDTFIGDIRGEKRVRKTVSRLSDVYDKTFEVKSERTLKPVIGNGTKLIDIIRIQDACQRNKIAGDLAQNLHLICYRSKGKVNKRLSSIKKFNGFDSNNELEYTKRISLCEKMKIDDLKLLSDLFNVHSTGKQKKDIIVGLINYLKSPFETGSHTFRMNALKRKHRGKSTKSTTTKTKNTKSNSSELDNSLSDIEDDEEDENKPEKGNSNSINKENLNKKKSTEKIKTDNKKPKKANKKKEPVEQTEQPLQESSQQINMNGDELNKSGEVLSDDSIKEKITEILSGADVNKITLNQVCDRVIELFPNIDLVHKRQHIKSLVKEVIDQSS